MDLINHIMYADDSIFKLKVRHGSRNDVFS